MSPREPYSIPPSPLRNMHSRSPSLGPTPGSTSASRPPPSIRPALSRKTSFIEPPMSVRSRPPSRAPSHHTHRTHHTHRNHHTSHHRRREPSEARYDYRTSRPHLERDFYDDYPDDMSDSDGSWVSTSSGHSGRHHRHGDWRGRTRNRSRERNGRGMVEGAIKTSLVFLGSIAAATFAAHKFWPGDGKEEMDMDKDEMEALAYSQNQPRAQPPSQPQSQVPSRAPSQAGDRRSQVSTSKSHKSKSNHGSRSGSQVRSEGRRSHVEINPRVSIARPPMRRAQTSPMAASNHTSTPSPATSNPPQTTTTGRYSTQCVASGSSGGDSRRQNYIHDSRTTTTTTPPTGDLRSHRLSHMSYGLPRPMSHHTELHTLPRRYIVADPPDEPGHQGSVSYQSREYAHN